MPKTVTPKWNRLINLNFVFQDNSPDDKASSIIYYHYNNNNEYFKIELNKASSKLIRDKVAELEALLKVETSLTGKVLERQTIQSIVTPEETVDAYAPAPVDPADV